MASIWLDKINYKENPSLNTNIEVDVLIIGGGITGMSIAYALKDSNLKVTLVEKNSIGHGITARTTGKLTYLQELIYSDLTETYCKQKAKLYLESQIDAIKIVDKIIKENKIECDLENDASYLFTNDSKDIKKLEKEYALLKSFGINVIKTDKLPDNKKVKSAIYVDDTKTFHPLKYLIKLKEILNNKIDIYENTKVIKIDKNTCYTERNIIKAKKIIIAMHYPYFLMPFLMPLKTHLEKSYICAYKVNKNLHFSAINTTKPSLSIRYINDYKIVLNNAHNLAFNNNDKNNFKKLISKTNKKPDYIWTNKDIITSDKLPFIGQIKDNLYIATGYNTWGMTNGILAGNIIADIIQNKDNKYIQLFAPKRGFNVNQVIEYPINIISSAKSFLDSKLNKNKSWYSDKIRFEKKDGKNIAIYIDENKKEHIVYNVCPHLKCSLIFNEMEKTWDCPCHGSRFDIDGKCIEGPSNYDITYKN